MVHSVLERQLRNVGAGIDTQPTLEQWRALLDRVDAAYVQEDRERYTLERSIATSSQEMADLNLRLATERDRLHATVTSLPEGLCLLSAAGLVEMANRAAEQMLGAEPGELAGRDFVALIGARLPLEPHGGSWAYELSGAIRNAQTYRCEDTRFATVDGRSIRVSFTLTPIDSSQSAGSAIVFADIRNRKASEDALRESESRFRAIFESAAVGIVRISVDGRIDDCNAAFSAMLGQEREAVLGRTIFALMHADEADTARILFEKVVATAGAGYQVERRYVHRDGSTVWANQTVSFVRGPEGAPVFAIAVVENTTAQRNLELSLRQAQKLESVGQLAAGIAHEINTPVQFVSDSVHFARDAVADLFSLLGSFRVLRDAAAVSFPEVAAEVKAAEENADIEYLSAQLPKALERALDGLQRVAIIVRGMKTFAHPDQKDKSSSDLNHALEATIAIARNEYKYVADVETELGVLPPVICHVGELNQVFLNVIVNAAHAIGDVVRGTEARGRIRIKTWLDGGFAVVSVSDTGAGIPESVRHRIFDPFFTTKEVGRGTGQGLAIARSVVVEKHQGAIDFQTETGKGTTFTIRLPIVPPNEGAKAA